MLKTSLRTRRVVQMGNQGHPGVWRYKALLDEGYARAKEILEANREKLDFIAEFLLMNEVMDGDQFAAAMDKNATVRELLEMAEEKKRRSDRENEERARAREAQLAEQQASLSPAALPAKDIDLTAAEEQPDDAAAEDAPTAESGDAPEAQNEAQDKNDQE